MNRTPVLLLALAFGFALGLPALHAGDDDGQSRREKYRRLVERFDRDGDGRLSREERAAMREFLEELRGRDDQPDVPQTIDVETSQLYKIKPGAFKVKRADDDKGLHDPDRDKRIPLRITWPEGEGPFPLIVFCHGALGSKSGAEPLVTHWASHGYIVIQPTFGDSVSLMTEEEKRQVRSIQSLLNSPRVLKQWDQRPRDVSHVLDSLDELEKQFPGIRGRIDREKIAVAGHSYGAHTTMLLAGMRPVHPFSRKTVSFRDARIKAFIAISPQGPGKSLKEASYQSMTGPMLMITGDNDGSPMRGKENLAGDWRRKAYEYAPAGDTYLLWIKDAHHGFGGINGNARWPGAGPNAPDQVLTIKSTCLAFFDAYVQENKEARAYLASDTIEKETKQAATIEKKTEAEGED